jgi:molecular chaperone GrpE
MMSPTTPPDSDDPDEADMNEQIEEKSQAETAEVECDATEPEDAVDATVEAVEAVATESEPPAAEAGPEDLQAKLDATHERWLRAMAELENFRRRSRRDLQTNMNLAKVQVIRELLEVVDNFGRALESAPWEHQEEGVRGFAEGVRMIYQQFSTVLHQMGLRPIEARGGVFDPNLHEAVSQIETEEVPSQHVVEVVQEGYIFNDVVVRPARVVVAL